jgi:hypothetical protein
LVRHNEPALCAKTDLEQMQQITCADARLFDHLVRAAEQVQRVRNTERLGGPHVDSQFDLGGLLDRQVGRFLALENPAGIDTGQMLYLPSGGVLVLANDVLVAAPHCPPRGAPMHARNASSGKWLPHSGIRTV